MPDNLDMITPERAGVDGRLDSRDWQRFLDATVHDLRAALRAIGTSAELLAQTCEGATGARDAVVVLLDGVRRLDCLSKGLGRYSRALQFERLDVAVSSEGALRSALDELSESIRARGAEVHHAALPSVLGNYESIAALFREILANALAYCDGSPNVQITVSRSDHDDRWRFAVKDNACGIERKHWEKIFLPFQRLHTRPRGNGLGLAICAKIVEAHGGAIWLESEPGSGSTFFFTLPGANG